MQDLPARLPGVRRRLDLFLSMELLRRSSSDGAASSSHPVICSVASQRINLGTIHIVRRW